MFTACTTKNVKKAILKSFCNVTGKLHVVVATIAFGMGLDCPNVRRIIHWGPPSDLEGYIQETGHGGRDNITATATLYYSKCDIRHEYIESSMKNYCICKNRTVCRRKMLFADFGPLNKDTTALGHMCCDVCACTCTVKGDIQN